MLEKLKKFETDKLLKENEIEFHKNKYFEVEAKLKQMEHQINVNRNTINTDLSNINESLKREIEEKTKKCSSLQNALNQKNVEIFDIQSLLEQLKKENENLARNKSLPALPHNEDQINIQKRYFEDKLKERDIEITSLKKSLKTEKDMYSQINSSYLQIKNDLMNLKKKNQELNEEYTKIMSQGITKESQIPPVHAATQPENQENFQNKYYQASQQIQMLEKTIENLRDELQKNKSQDYSMNKDQIKHTQNNLNLAIKQLQEELSKEKAKSMQLAAELDQSKKDFEKFTNEFAEYKFSNPEKSGVNDVQFDIFFIQMANSGFKRSSTESSFADEFTRLLEEYKRMSYIEKAPESTEMIYEGKKYSGMITEGKPNGVGRMEYQDSSFYLGSFVNGVKEGYGITINKSKNTKYYGEFRNNVANGYGVFIDEADPSKRIFYYGQFDNEAMEGEGTYIFPDYDIYVGQRSKGKMHGNGIIYFRNGGFYKGDFENGKKAGYGIFSYADKSKYEGLWENDLMHGKGKFFKPDQTEIYEGEFKEGKFHGTFVHTKDSRQTIEIWDSGRNVTGLPSNIPISSPVPSNFPQTVQPNLPPTLPPNFQAPVHNNFPALVPHYNPPQKNLHSFPPVYNPYGPNANMLNPPSKNQEGDSSTVSSIQSIKVTTKKY